MTDEPEGNASQPHLLWSDYIDVGDGHEIYVEAIGDIDGVPAIFLHGGPGSGCNPEHRTLFADGGFHAVLFDQRGAGRSKPHRKLDANTTDHLVQDMETIRSRLNFDKWMLVGGSWGATLALAYAEQHPERVLGIVLRATFLGTRAELDVAFGDTLARFYPVLYRDFLELLPVEERDDPLPAYWRRILGKDEAVSARFIWAWALVERALASLKSPLDRLDATVWDRCTGTPPASAFIEAHYFTHECFLRDKPLLENASRLAGIPGIIIQGRYDLLCPPETAYALASRWPDAEIRVVEGAGHLLGDPGIRDAVAMAMSDMLKLMQSIS